MVLGQPDRQRIVAELRERIRAIEGRGGEARMRPSVAPDWLPAGCRIAGGEIHEVLAGGDTDAAATAFAAALAGRLTAQGPVMWLGDVHGPGLTEFGLDSARLIVGRIVPTDLWWTVEEATRCRGVGAVLASVHTPPSPIVGRRVRMCATPQVRRSCCITPRPQRHHFKRRRPAGALRRHPAFRPKCLGLGCRDGAWSCCGRVVAGTVSGWSSGVDRPTGWLSSVRPTWRHPCGRPAEVRHVPSLAITVAN